MLGAVARLAQDLMSVPVKDRNEGQGGCPEMWPVLYSLLEFQTVNKVIPALESAVL